MGETIMVTIVNAYSFAKDVFNKIPNGTAFTFENFITRCNFETPPTNVKILKIIKGLLSQASSKGCCVISRMSKGKTFTKQKDFTSSFSRIGKLGLVVTNYLNKLALGVDFRFKDIFDGLESEYKTKLREKSVLVVIRKHTKYGSMIESSPLVFKRNRICKLGAVYSREKRKEVELHEQEEKKILEAPQRSEEFEAYVQDVCQKVEGYQKLIKKHFDAAVKASSERDAAYADSKKSASQVNSLQNRVNELLLKVSKLEGEKTTLQLRVQELEKKVGGLVISKLSTRYTIQDPITFDNIIRKKI